MSENYIIMNPTDNCATSLEALSKDISINIANNIIIKLKDDIPLGHKFALKFIKKGELIYKYGQIIGVATADIREGDWVHIHNVKSHYLEQVKK